jgi:hypothetical protein
MKIDSIVFALGMIFFVPTAFAQQGINYKAIINDANGDALVNTAVTIQFTILEKGTTAVYQETHNPTTDVNGIVIVNIGMGTVINGDFIAINWGSNPYFLKTEIDIGEGLTDMGITEFRAVPYALHAETANSAIIDEVDDADADPVNELQTLTLVDNTLSLSNGGSVELPVSGQYYYVDKDEDGYGNPFTPVFVPLGANAPAYVVLDFGDCNDDDQNVNPGESEIADGIDNNCNGEIDEIN